MERQLQTDTLDLQVALNFGDTEALNFHNNL